MFILYFYDTCHPYDHAKYYQGWPHYDEWRPGEGAWLVPGSDPDDPLYVE